MHKVVFDTNSINNDKSTKEFLGGRAELEKFSKIAEIVIPDIVIEEIKNHKRKHLNTQRSSFLSNPFHYLLRIDEKITKNLDIEKVVSDLEKDEICVYTKILLRDKDILEKIKVMSLKNEAPFSENSDKGFKDVYLYFTVLEYASNQKDEKIFFVTKDERLKKSFENIKNVQIIESYSEFQKYIDDYFKEEYFINRLKEEISGEINSDKMIDSWLNINENWVLEYKIENKIYRVEVDFKSREIVGYAVADFNSMISELISARSFQVTHSAISDLNEYVQYLSDEEIQKIIQASVINEQIFWISSDDDVKEFFCPIYNAKKSILEEEVKTKFHEYFLKEKAQIADLIEAPF